MYVDMHSRRAWVKKGKVLKTRKVKCYQKRLTFTMAISSKKVIATYLTLGSMNTEKYHDFLQNKVIPKLESNHTHLLMDNVSFHKTKKIKRLLENENKKAIYTVPYTPDLNPIENVFSVVKHYVRKKVLKQSKN